MNAEERLDNVAELATRLLVALQPWQAQAAQVREAATRLTVAPAAIPLRDADALTEDAQ